MKKMSKAAEIFVYMRETSRPRANCFRWYQYRDMFKTINGPSMHWGADAWKTTIGSVLRAWLSQGLIRKLDKGMYQFTELGLSSDPRLFRMYVRAGETRKHFVKNAHLRAA